MRGIIIRSRAAFAEYPPSHYLNRFYVDSAVFDQRALQFLVDTMGADRVMLGSDYPFPSGEERVGSLIRESHLLADDEAKLLGGNAARFLGLQANRARSRIGATRIAISKFNADRASDGSSLTART